MHGRKRGQSRPAWIATLGLGPAGWTSPRVFALSGWRPGSVWTLIGGGIIAATIAVGVYLAPSRTTCS
jgi:hypothetical protein